MKRIVLSFVLIAAMISGNAAFAQKGKGTDAATTKGDWIFDFGVGVGFGNTGYYNGYSPNYNGYNGNGWKYNNSSHNIMVPTLSVSLQKAFWDDITIGGQISFNAFSNSYYHRDNNYLLDSKYKQYNSFFTARGEYHFNRLIGLEKKYDLYAGALAGFQINLNSEERIEGNPNTPNKNTYKSNNLGSTGGIFGGFRYYFKDQLSVYGEVGWAITNVRVGLAWKL